MPKAIKVVILIAVLFWLVSAGLVVAGIYTSRAHGPAGQIEITTPTAELRLRTGYILEKNVTVRSEDSPVNLAGGIYRPGKIAISKELGEDLWKLESFGPPWGALSEITVKPGKTVVIKFGPPLVAKAEVIIDGRNVSIGYAIAGQSGEHYESITRNGRAPELPRFEIVDQSGGVLLSGQFEYG